MMESRKGSQGEADNELASGRYDPSLREVPGGKDMRRSACS